MIISIEEARKILGKEGANMTDEQISDTILALDAIARETIRACVRGEFRMAADREEVTSPNE